MSTSPLRVVYDAVEPAPPPRPAPVALTSTDALEPLLRQKLEHGEDGELLLRGAGTARLCLFEGRIAWVRLAEHPEHLGDVMRRELGLPVAELRKVVAHCRVTGQRFSDGLSELGLVEPPELRECMRRHIGAQLQEVMAWPGLLTLEHSGWPHRYDHTTTFDLEELLDGPGPPDHAQQDRLDAIVRRCHQRLPKLKIACVIEAEDGVVLHPGAHRSHDQEAAQDLLALCTAGVRRLAANRLTRADGAPEGMMLITDRGALVVQQLAWHPGWLLVLGGGGMPARMLKEAELAASEPPR